MRAGLPAQNLPPPIPLWQVLKTKPFRGTLTVSPRDIALEEAAKEYSYNDEIPAGERRQTYWTDGATLKQISDTDSGCGLGIVQYSPADDKWIGRSWHPKKCNDAIEMPGLLAIAKALQIAWEEYLNTKAEERPNTIRV